MNSAVARRDPRARVVHRRRIAAATIVAVGAVAACGDDASQSGRQTVDGRLTVVTTTTQLTDFVRNVGGAEVEVYAVLRANVDPHDYEPTPADLEAIASADVVVENGVGLEAWFADTVASADPQGVIVDSSTGVAIRPGNGSDEERHGDPHIWQNPKNAKIMVRNIADALEAADPGAATTFEENVAHYSAQLDALDASIKVRLDALANKKLVTNHDAFGYYVDHYGLQFVGSIIPSFDTQAELSPADINDLVARIRQEGVKAIFSETSLPPKTAKAIAAEAGVNVVAGDGALYGDSLGPAGSDGDTYLKMLDHNTRAIVDNLA